MLPGPWALQAVTAVRRLGSVRGLHSRAPGPLLALALCRLQPELEVMQSLLAAANRKSYVSSRARASMRTPQAIVESPQSLTPASRKSSCCCSRGCRMSRSPMPWESPIHTVKDYGKSIRVKYNVKTRVQLISALLGRALQTSR